MKNLFLLIISVTSIITIKAQITWEPIPGIFGDSDVESVATAPDGKWYIKGHNVLYSSSDEGSTWVSETPFGFDTDIRNLKFLQDGTPIFGTDNPNGLLIKREGQWVQLPATNDFEVFLDTLYVIRSNHVQKSYDRGLTWITHLKKQGSSIYRYRQHLGRHYIEYSDGSSRKFGEVTLDGTILRWNWSELSDYQMFVIDDCDNAHFLYDDNHSVLYADGTDESHSFNFSDGKYTYYKDRIYRLVNDYLYKNVPCGLNWEYVGEFDKARDFFAVGRDTIMFAFENNITVYTLPQIEISHTSIQNTNYISWFQEEIPDGTRFLKTNGGSYRVRPDGTQELMDVDLLQMRFSNEGWIYQDWPRIPLKQVYSKDAGVTWDTLDKPAQVSEFTTMYPVTSDISAYVSSDGTYITLSDGNVYLLPSDPDNNIYHSYYHFQLWGDLLLMCGNSPVKVAVFNLSTREFQSLLYTNDASSIWVKLDGDGTLFYLENNEKKLHIAPYPYDKNSTVVLPYGIFQGATAVDNGYLVAHAYALYHFTKDLVMTTIDIGPMANTQLASIVYSKGSKWLANTYSRTQGAYITSNPITDNRTRITGSIFDANNQCLKETEISPTNWKIHFTNAEDDILAIGQPGNSLNFSLPPGDYNVEVIPPPYSVFSTCDWPQQLTVPENGLITNWDITSQVSTCDAAIISFSSVFYRRCFETWAYINIRNAGSTILINPEIKLEPGVHQTIISSPYGYTQNENTFTFLPGSIDPGESLLIPVKLVTQCSAELGQELCIKATIDVPDKCAGLNYTDVLCMATIGAWDPNDKQVTNDTGLAITHFAKNDFINYKIRFQNTGTDTAFNIRIEDVIDQGLDLMTFEMIASSHECTYQIEDGRNLVIYYSDIKLPDSTRNLIGSSGFFEFRVRAVDEINPGDTIFNTADIYFDFNDPVVTNTVPVILEIESDLEQEPLKVTEFTIKPNPATNQISIELMGLSKPFLATFLNVNGEVVGSFSLSDEDTSIPVDNLMPGIYFVKIHDGGNVYLQKFLKI